MARSIGTKLRPSEFQRSSKWPVILALHGGGDYGNDGIRQTAGALG